MATSRLAKALLKEATAPQPATPASTNPNVPNKEQEEPQISSKVIEIGAPNVTQRVRMVQDFLDNMVATHDLRKLLSGSTGIGKTQFVYQLRKLLGMELIVVEVPHITEEKIINIPFMIFDRDHPNGSAKSEQVKMETKGGRTYEIVMGKSYLASELSKKTLVPEAQWLKDVHSDPNLAALYQGLGGTEDTIPPEIAKVRQKYHVILFLDEYWRQTTDNVRNILRTILNKHIGNDPMPPHAYVIYASNMSDVGQTVEKVQTNADMEELKFEPPTKNEWFHYFVNQFEKDTRVKLQPIVVNAFYQALEDKHISYDDFESEIRTSPRRWEQVLLYVNANVPVDSPEKAAALLANIKSNFGNEKNFTSDLYPIVDKTVRRILKETSGEDLSTVKAADASAWRDILKNQIETKQALGDLRKYVPVISGAPGIGKTSHMADIAEELNLRLIYIDCSTFNADETTGIPIPHKEDDGSMSVEFSMPALYLMITNKMKDADASFLKHASAKEKADYAKQQYKYLVFFDELSRVKSQTVFNSLRRVILEKSFSDTVKLPPSAIVVSAMNPEDTRGVQELTGHMKDSVDIINAKAHWGKWRKHLDDWSEKHLSDLSSDATGIAKKVLDLLIQDFSLKNEKPQDNIGPNDRQFHLVTPDGLAYINPRELKAMYENMARALNRAIPKTKDIEPSQAKDMLVDEVMHKVTQTIKFVVDRKHQSDSSEILRLLRGHLNQVFDDLLEKKTERADLGEMLERTLADPDRHLADDPNFVNMIKNFSPNVFLEEFTTVVKDIIAKEDRSINTILKHTHPTKSIKDKVITKGVENGVSKIEYIINELKLACEAHKASADIPDIVSKAIRAILLSDEFQDKFNEENPTNEEFDLWMQKMKQLT